MQQRATIYTVGLALLCLACAPNPPEQPTINRTNDSASGSVLPPANTNEDLAETPAEAPRVNDDGRLVVEGLEGQLSTMRPDGSDHIPLTDDPNYANTHPSWAPDGSRIAWVRVDRATGQASVAADRYDRSDLRSVKVASTPFYLYWDQSASKIAHLSPSEGGIDLRVTELFADDGPSDKRLDRGDPYWVVWSPGGDELLVHASGFRLDRIDLDEATVIVDETPGLFGAPIWLRNGNIYFAQLTESTSRLVMAGPSGQGTRPLVSYDGYLRFAASNSGNRIVMQANPHTVETKSAIVTASYDQRANAFEIPVDTGSDQPFTTSAHRGSRIGPYMVKEAHSGTRSLTVSQSAPSATPDSGESLESIGVLKPGVPYVMGSFGGEPQPLPGHKALGLYPSPDGNRIAWLESSTDHEEAVRWRVSEGSTIIETDDFILSETFSRNYLPFFDQYERSHDFWSPSSRLLVFAGRPASLPNDRDGIWILNADTATTVRIGDGVLGVFTRTPAALGAASAL